MSKSFTTNIVFLKGYGSRKNIVNHSKYETTSFNGKTSYWSPSKNTNLIRDGFTVVDVQFDPKIEAMSKLEEVAFSLDKFKKDVLPEMLISLLILFMGISSMNFLAIYGGIASILFIIASLATH